jgi:integrase
MARILRKQRGIFERPARSGIWWICYFDQFGRKHREKVGMKQSAIAAYQKRKTEVREGRFFPKVTKSEVLFDEIGKDALDYSKANKCPDAYRLDKWHYAVILSWFNGRVAKEIVPQEIDEKLSGLAGKKDLKPATLNRYRAFLSLVYSLANRNGKVEVNPARLVRLRKENNAVVRFLEAEEEEKLRRVLRESDRYLEAEFDLALNTGMRRGEQYRLRWEDVNCRLGIITIPRSKHGERRYIPINSAAKIALEVLQRQTDGSGYVVPGAKAPRNKDPRRTFEAAVKESGILNFRYHDIRHTFASRLVMAGVDLRTVQELMGHKTVAMTIRYSHLAPSHQREAIERLVSVPSQRPQKTPTDTRTDTSDFQVNPDSTLQTEQVH